MNIKTEKEILEEYKNSNIKWKIMYEELFELVKESFSFKNDISVLDAKPKQKYIWVCNKFHETTMALNTYLARTFDCVGCNSLEALYPEVAKEVSFNSELKAVEVTPRSNRKVLWYCSKCKGEYYRTPDIKIHQAKDCPYCTNFFLLQGFNDFATAYEEALEFWDYENNTANPLDIIFTYSKKIFWKCPQNSEHAWECKPAYFLPYKDKCPFCLKQQGRNYNRGSVEKVAPYLIDIWSNKNPLSAKDTLWEGKKKVFLKCNKGHDFIRSLSKVRKQKSCSICSNRVLSIGHNDVETLHPELLDIWSCRNTTSLKDYKPTSKAIVYWDCLKGHLYKQEIFKQINRNLCIICCPFERSAPEFNLYQYIKSLNFKVIRNNRELLDGLETDIYLPSINKAIEFNGDYWHSKAHVVKNNGVFNSAIDYHNFKKNKCSSKGIELAFVWEYDWKNNNKEIIDSLNKWLLEEVALEDLPILLKSESVLDNHTIYN